MVINLFLKQTIFNIKFFINNKKQILLFLFPILLSLFMAILFFPITLGFSVILETSLIMPLGIIFVSLSFNVRNSTLYSNLEVTKNSKYTFFLSIYILMLLYSIIILLLLMGSLTILSQFKILETGWLTYDKNFMYHFFNKNFFIVILSTIEITTILFVISFLFLNISKSQNTYYILLFSITILNVIFGGTMNSYFWAVPGTTALNKSTDLGIRYSPNIFPSWTFIISLIYPFYAPGQLLLMYGQKSLINISNEVTLNGDAWKEVVTLQWQQASNTSMEYLSSMWRWNIVLLMPMIQIVTIGLTGIIIPTFKKKIINDKII